MPSGLRSQDKNVPPALGRFVDNKQVNINQRVESGTFLSRLAIRSKTCRRASSVAIANRPQVTTSPTTQWYFTAAGDFRSFPTSRCRQYSKILTRTMS